MKNKRQFTQDNLINKKKQPNPYIHLDTTQTNMTSLIQRMKFREIEEQEIQSFITSHDEQKFLMITGQPGCGKTMLLTQCLKQWQNNYTTIYINAMQCKNYEEFLNIYKKHLNIKNSFGKYKIKEQNIIIIIDEFDNLFKVSEKEAFDLFSLSKYAIIIGISNDTEFLQTQSVRYKFQLPQYKNLILKPYTIQQLQEIVLDIIKQMKISKYDENAIKLLTTRAYNDKGGDMRNIIDIVKRALRENNEITKDAINQEIEYRQSYQANAISNKFINKINQNQIYKMSNKKFTTILNAKNKLINYIEIEKDPFISGSSKPNICIIQQAYFQSQEKKIEEIIESIVKLQSQIYYSQFVKKNEKYNQKSNSKSNDIYQDLKKKFDFNIDCSLNSLIDNRFVRKLYDFQIYKQKQLEKIAQIPDKKQNQMILNLLNNFLKEENQELRQQLFNLYKKIKTMLDLNYYAIVLLDQNFHPQYNLLLHTSSIIQSIFCQEYEQNQLLDFQKFAYINLTGNESDDNLQFWKDFNYYYQNFCLYFSIYNSENNLSNKISNIQTIISSNNKRISEFEMKFIYNFYFKNKIVQFKPLIIYVDICNSEQFSIDQIALDKLLRKLQQYAKLVIHIKYDMKSQNLEESSLEFLRTLNACLFGIQKFQKISKVQSNIEIKQKLSNSIKFIDQLIKNNQKQNHLSNYLQIQKYCLKKKEMSLDKLLNELKIILIGEKQNYIIEALDKQEKKINFERVVISYQYKIIILLDFSNQGFYFFKDFSTNFQDSTQQSFQFTQFNEKIPLQGDIIDTIVIINEKQIFFGYPIIKNQGKTNQDIILCYDLDKDKWQIIQRNQNLNQVKEKYEYFENNYKTEQIIKQLRQYQISGQTVCYQNLNQEGFQNYYIVSLFGGEVIDSYKPLNLIEYLFINIKENLFYSKFIRRSTDPRVGSLKPSPFQLVLPIKNIDILTENKQISCAYLILRSWNQTKNNFYETMLNPQNLKTAQLAIFFIDSQYKDKYKTIFLDIEYKILKKINMFELMNEDVNWIEIENQSNLQNNQKLWKAVYTNYLKIKNVKYSSELGDQQKNKNKNVDLSIVSLEFIISLNYKLNDNDNDNPNLKNTNDQQNLQYMNPKNWSVETEIDWYWRLDQQSQ